MTSLELQRACPHLVRGWEWRHDGYTPAIYVQLGPAISVVEFADTLWTPVSTAWKFRIPRSVPPTVSRPASQSPTLSGAGAPRSS
jgi:hypothetical protein